MHILPARWQTSQEKALRMGPEEVGHASCHVISLAHARSLDSATFIHQDGLLATFVLWSTYNRHGIVQTIDRAADLKQ